MKASEEKGGKIERRVRRDRSAEDAEKTNGKDARLKSKSRRPLQSQIKRQSNGNGEDARAASRDGRYKVKIAFNGQEPAGCRRYKVKIDSKTSPCGRLPL
jgi:hypothetical protein